VTLRFALSRGRARRGEALEARVTLTLDEPWIVHGPRPASRDFAATTIAVLDSELAAGAPVYPAASMLKRAYNDEPLGVYIGAVAFTAPLRVPETAPPGERRVRMRVRYQPCGLRECQPPESVVLETAFEVVVE
jgi:hypothetical protein